MLLLEAAPREWRGGNSQHTRNLRCMHDAPQDVLVDAYPEEEFWQDLLKVTGGRDRRKARAAGDPRIVDMPPVDAAARRALSAVACRARCTPPAPTRSSWAAAKRSSMRITAAQRHSAWRFATTRRSIAWNCARAGSSPHMSAPNASKREACVLAAGGFESNREWLREAWGPNDRGEWPADNFLDPRHALQHGRLLRFMIDAGADTIGDPTQAHMVAIDARAPLYDGGICTRIDCVSLGIVVNRDAQRFYDEGEDFWPKRYAIWGRLVAQQPGQIAYSIIDAKAIGRFMPPVFPGTKAETLAELPRTLGLDESRFMQTLNAYNAACRLARSITPFSTTAEPTASRQPSRTGRGPSIRRLITLTR